MLASNITGFTEINQQASTECSLIVFLLKDSKHQPDRDTQRGLNLDVWCVVILHQRGHWNLRGQYINMIINSNWTLFEFKVKYLTRSSSIC